jgi:hypothetical protein
MERVARLKQLIELMKLLPDDIVYLMEGSETGEEMKLVSDVMLELMNLTTKIQREVASRLVRRIVAQ